MCPSLFLSRCRALVSVPRRIGYPIGKKRAEVSGYLRERLFHLLLPVEAFARSEGVEGQEGRKGEGAREGEGRRVRIQLQKTGSPLLRLFLLLARAMLSLRRTLVSLLVRSDVTYIFNDFCYTSNCEGRVCSEAAGSLRARTGAITPFSNARHASRRWQRFVDSSHSLIPSFSHLPPLLRARLSAPLHFSPLLLNYYV